MFACAVCFSTQSQSKELDALSSAAIEQADFFIFDITDNKKPAVRGVDAYRVGDKVYVAITPLLEGLRIKYRFNKPALTIDFLESPGEFLLSDNRSDTGDWFYDDVYYFISTEIIEEAFGSQVTVNTARLILDLSGHQEVFPYQLIQNQSKQRQYQNFRAEADTSTTATTSSGNLAITIPDEYRAFTVPTGSATLDMRSTKSKTTYNALVQTVSDLMYHSTEFTLLSDEEETNSRLTFSRYPSYQGEKLLGVWDYYSFGDIWLRDQTSQERVSKGLGVKFGYNQSDSVHQNMATSFTKSATPGWEVDVFHNGVYLETRTVPDDGVLVFEDVEVYFGANEFKLLLFGPYGEEQALYHNVRVEKNSLSEGDHSMYLSFEEYDSSLLDINSDSFDIDAMSVSANYGVFDNWSIGSSVRLLRSGEEGDDVVASGNLSNRVTVPGWLLQHNLSYSEQSVSQQASLATQSIFTAFDNFSLSYDSIKSNGELDDSETISSLETKYNIRLGRTLHNLNLFYEDSLNGGRDQGISYRTSFNTTLFSISNQLSYREFNDGEDLTNGVLSVSSRVADGLRVVATIPYELDEDNNLVEQSINVSGNYSLNDRWENRHVFSASVLRQFDNEYLYGVGYNFSLVRPTHQFIFSSRYDSADNWRLSAGIRVNFGYDYFNNRIKLTGYGGRSSGVLDVHAYLDRRLNGVPDVLDLDLPGVTFSGNRAWVGSATNSKGQVRLFNTPNKTFTLQSKWENGANTINNDYVVYSHPGSLQRVNLPFYLTTEIELFVLLQEGESLLNIPNVTVVAENTVTGYTYETESDIDGYVSFVNLTPGQYKVSVKSENLESRGLYSSVESINFKTPAKGGFVVLPNLLLSRTQDTDKPEVIDIELTEENYISTINDPDNRFIHLQPDGNFLAPHSLDSLDDISYKKQVYEIKSEERKRLRQALNEADKGSNNYKYGLNSAVNLSLDTASGTYLLFIGGYASVEDAKLVNESAEVIEDELSDGNKIFRIKAGEFDSLEQAQEVAEERYSNQVFKIYKVGAEFITPSETESQQLEAEAISGEAEKIVEPDVVDTNQQSNATPSTLTDGWVVQFAAAKSIDGMSAVKESLNIESELYIAIKLVNGVEWYCIISSVQASKGEADDLLSNSGLDGFVVKSDFYKLTTTGE